MKNTNIVFIFVGFVAFPIASYGQSAADRAGMLFGIALARRSIRRTARLFEASPQKGFGNSLVALMWVISCLLVSVEAQSRRTFEGFSLDINRANRATAISFEQDDSAGCSSVYTANALLQNVTWDTTPTKFVASFRSGRKTFFVPDAINSISNAGRGLLADIFKSKNRVRISWKECGSGNIADLVAVKVLP